MSQRVTRNSPETLLGTSTSEPNYIDPRHGEFDATGSNVGTVTNYQFITVPAADWPLSYEGSDMMYQDGRFVPCEYNGLRTPCRTLRQQMNAGAVSQSSTYAGSTIPLVLPIEPHGLNIFTITTPDFFRDLRTGQPGTRGPNDTTIADGWRQIYWGGTDGFSVNWGPEPQNRRSSGPLPVDPPPGKESLSDCLVSLLEGFFPDYAVNGDRVRIAADARFVKSLVPLAGGASAMTLGLYNISYVPGLLNIESPGWSDLDVIVEELVHGEQFIRMWQSMADIPATLGRVVSRTGVGRETSVRDIPGTPARRPNHGEALQQWVKNYINATANALAIGGSAYESNEYEIAAKARRDRIMRDLRTKYNKAWHNGEKLCP